MSEDRHDMDKLASDLEIEGDFLTQLRRISKPHYDSAGRRIEVGDKIRFRGKVFTLAGYGPKEDHYGVNTLIFEEPVEHTPEIPHECNVDLVER